MNGIPGSVRPPTSTWAHGFAAAPALDQIRSGSKILKPGHQGPAVREIKELLNEIGQSNPNYGTPLVVNDDFDKEMLLKVTWFQRSYRQVYKSKIDGEVGPRTLTALEAVRDVKSVPSVAETKAPDAPPLVKTKAPDAPPPVAVTSPVQALAPENKNNPLGLTASIGTRSANHPKDVRKVQEALVRHGYLRGKFTPEKLDAPTKSAIKRCQEEQTRFRDRRVDTNGLLARLLAQESLPKPVRYLGLSDSVGVLSPGADPHRDDVRAVQERLVRHGFLAPGAFEPGENDEATIEAILKFQLTFTPLEDGRVDPAGLTSELLARDELPKVRADAAQRLRAEFGDGGGQQVAPALAKPAGETPVEPPPASSFPLATATVDADKIAWTQRTLAGKTFLAQEPKTNLTGQAMPPWFDAKRFIDEQKLTGARAALTGDLGKGSLPSVATHFVVHETDGRGFPHKGPHLYVGLDDGHYKLQHDFASRSGGTKLESRHARRLRQQGVQMVHVELETSPLKGNFPWKGVKQVYPDHQYRDLAIAYVMASHKAGKFITVVPHREVDRGLADGHSDPRDFDFGRFYAEVAKLVDLPAGTTFGYDPARDGIATDEEPRGPGGLNYRNSSLARSPVFPNIYGSLPC